MEGAPGGRGRYTPDPAPGFDPLLPRRNAMTFALIQPRFEDPTAASSVGDALPGVAIGLAILVCVAAGVWLLTQLLARLKEVQGALGSLERLDSIDTQVRALTDQQKGLDLARLEHVLIDLRDAQKRLEERLVGAVEAQGRAASSESEPPRRASLSERVMSRLLAMGFERIEVLTSHEDLDAIGEGDGDVLVEARKGGAMHKGRAIVKAGSISDVRLRSAYESFP